MSIQTANVGITDTTTFTSVGGQSAVTLMSLCNYGAVSQTVSVYIVTATNSASDANIFVKEIEIAPADTFIIYQGGEKIILDEDDSIVAIASAANAVTAITSYMII